jgi:hypothetical protein
MLYCFSIGHPIISLDMTFGHFGHDVIFSGIPGIRTLLHAGKNLSFIIIIPIIYDLPRRGVVSFISLPGNSPPFFVILSV